MAKILIVDDHPANRQFLTNLLPYSGHTTIEAADGAEALEQARAERPDLVITGTKQADGSIEIESEPGRGTTFKIYLPRTGAVSKTAPAVEQRSEDRRRVLLVEDEEMVRQLISQMLQHLGHDVIEAPGPEAALSRVAEEQNSIDLILTDVIMPEMDGPELGRQIRALQPAAKILYMSGYTETIALTGDLVAGEASFIQKPFSVRSLKDKLNEVLPQTKGARLELA